MFHDKVHNRLWIFQPVRTESRSPFVNDLNLAARYSDYLIAIKNSRIYAAGEPKEVLTEKNLEEIFEIEAQVFEDTRHGCPWFIPIQTTFHKGETT